MQIFLFKNAKLILIVLWWDLQKLLPSTLSEIHFFTIIWNVVFLSTSLNSFDLHRYVPAIFIKDYDVHEVYFPLKLWWSNLCRIVHLLKDSHLIALPACCLSPAWIESSLKVLIFGTMVIIYRQISKLHLLSIGYTGFGYNLKIKLI